MSYTIDKKTGDVIIKGFEQGISQDPYEGISNIRNMNLISIPKEASVNFSTSKISPPSVGTGTVSSANAGTYYLTYTGAALLENYMTIVFSAQSGLGVSTNTNYWIKNLGVAGAGTFQITSDYAQTTVVHVTNGTGTFTNQVMGANLLTGGTTGVPKYSAYDNVYSNYYILETTTGSLWTNAKVTDSSNQYWTYTGPSGSARDISGRGLGFYKSFNNFFSAMFVLREDSIDYFNTQSFVWTFGWNPLAGTTSQTGATLKTASDFHNAYVGTDNVFYYCDGSFIGSFFEKSNGPSQSIVFDPTNPATYTFAAEALALPTQDSAQCISELGTKLLIGGKNNAIYPWDRSSPSFAYPILLPEYNVVQLLNINTNVYIFCGNRGRIYIYSGAQVGFYIKIPDHISGTEEPYYTWGGVTTNKNQIYMSFLVTKNDSSVAVNEYGGIWAIDSYTKALRLVNQLSYGTYAGYASTIIPNFANNPAGTGLYAGWQSAGSPTPGTIGIDTTIGTPYTGGQATIDSDLIPIGTFLKPTTSGRVEFKLAVPLATGETVSLWYRQKFSDTFVQIGSTITSTTNGAGKTFSYAYQNVPFQNSQWIQIRAVLTSTTTSPSYVRLTQLILGN